MNVGQRVEDPDRRLRGTTISVPYSRPSHLAVDVRWDDGHITSEDHRSLRELPEPGRHRKPGMWRTRFVFRILSWK